MKKWVLGAAIATALVGYANAKELSSAQKRAVEAALKKELIDPESARFIFPDYLGGGVYCGQVNSKNRLGGYAGNAVFQVTIMPQAGGKSLVLVLGVGSADREDPTSSALITTCAEKGYKI